MRLSSDAPANPESNRHDSRRIAIFEPNLVDLDAALTGREVSRGTAEFLKNLLQRKKWVRKINIPSGCDDVAAVLLFATTLKVGGLEILSELHIYCGGKVLIEKWEVAGETEHIRSLPKESFQAIDITKVRVEGPVVKVEFTVPTPAGKSGLHETIFDFGSEGPDVRTVPHPMLQRFKND